MDTQTAITLRRAVKHFDKNHCMAKEEIDKLISLAMLSPTAFNIQNWRFVLACDPEQRKRLREAAWGQAQVTDASLLIVICADLRAWEREPLRYWRNAPQPQQEYILPAMENYYKGHEQVQRDEAMRSAGIVAQTLMLSAKSMGYDSCPMDGFDFNHVAKIIQLPDDHVIAMFVAIGKGIRAPNPRSGPLSMEEVVVHNHF